MKSTLPLPVKCNVCNECICYCARTYELENLSEEELVKLTSVVEDIKKREEYLQSLRQYIESKMKR